MTRQVRWLRQLLEQFGGSLMKEDEDMRQLQNRVDGARLREADAVQWLRDRDAAEVKLAKIRKLCDQVGFGGAVSRAELRRILDGEPQP